MNIVRPSSIRFEARLPLAILGSSCQQMDRTKEFNRVAWDDYVTKIGLLPYKGDRWEHRYNPGFIMLQNGLLPC